MAPAVRTRSNSKVTSAPAGEDMNKSPPAATPSEVAVSGYPGKPSDKGKGIPKALHFKNGVGNTYSTSTYASFPPYVSHNLAGSQTAKQSSISSSASARSANSFSPLVPLQEDNASDDDDNGERTLEEELARTLIGADALDAAAELVNKLDKGKGKEVRDPD
jgi:hypothetical protein